MYENMFMALVSIQCMNVTDEHWTTDTAQRHRPRYTQRRAAKSI